MNQTMPLKQLSNLVNPMGHTGNRSGACPRREPPFLQRRGLFTGALNLDFDSAPADASGDVWLTGIVGASVGLLRVTAGQIVDVFDNSSHYGFFSWCLHDRSISAVDILVTVR